MMWDGYLTVRPGNFAFGKEIGYPLYRKLGGPQGGAKGAEKLSRPTRFDPRTVQSVASRYTVYDIPAHNVNYRILSNLIRTSFCRFLKRKKGQFAVPIRTFPSNAPCLQGRLIE
jgi:hypothetical protein